MDRDLAKTLLANVTGVLGGTRSRSNLLDDIAWPRSVETEFFAGGASSLPKIAYAVPRDDLEVDVADLARARDAIAGDEPIAVWLREVLGAAIDKDRLLLAAGTREFGRLSREIYGGATSTFLGLGTRNVDLADHLTERLRVHGWDAAKDREEAPMDTQAFSDALAARIAKHRPHIALDVTIDHVCSAKALAACPR